MLVALQIGAGVRAIQIRPHEKMDSICFFVLRTDGSAEDFSYRKVSPRLSPWLCCCCTGCPAAPDTIILVVLAALTAGSSELQV